MPNEKYKTSLGGYLRPSCPSSGGTIANHVGACQQRHCRIWRLSNQERRYAPQAARSGSRPARGPNKGDDKNREPSPEMLGRVLLVGAGKVHGEKGGKATSPAIHPLESGDG